ncbi:MAG: ABC transporter permease [Planctomycetes bacterium]|nr:ABC transporter permease [Planctomycetota bacterium]
MLSVIGVLSFLFFWQMLVATGMVLPRYLAPPTRVIVTFFDKLTNPNPDGSTLPVNILVSLQVSLSGFIAAVVLGIPLGLLMGWYKGIDKFIRPVFELLRPIPPVAWIPLTIIWFGIGLSAKAFIIFFSAFVPCVINAYTGIRMANQVFIDVAKTFGASNLRTFMRVGVPSSLPMVFAGIRIALANSWTTLVAAEMLAANAGLGFMILMGRQFVRPDIIILGMLVIGVIGVILTFALSKVENRLVGWRAGR